MQVKIIELAIILQNAQTIIKIERKTASFSADSSLSSGCMAQAGPARLRMSYAGTVKFGQHLLGRGAGLLCVTEIKTAKLHVADRGVVIERGNALPELGEGIEPAGGRRVLAHEAEHDAPPRKGLRHPVDNAKRVVKSAGQHEVAYDNSASDKSFGIKPARPDLMEHLHDRSLCPLRIIRRKGIARGKPGVGIFHVRKIHGDAAVKPVQRFGFFIGRAVPDDGNTGGKALQRTQNGLAEMAGGHEIYIMNAAGAQSVHDFAQFRVGDDFSDVRTAAYLMVLTKNTAKIAAGEKNRAASAASADAGLLSEMGRGTADDGIFRTAAKTGSTGLAVCAAFTRT